MSAGSEERVCLSPETLSASARAGTHVEAIGQEIDDQNARAYIESIEERLDQIAIHKTVWYGRFGADYFTSATGRVSRHYYELGYVKLDDAWRICYRFRSDTRGQDLDRESSAAQDVAPLISAPWYVRGDMIRCIDCLASAILSLA